MTALQEAVVFLAATVIAVPLIATARQARDELERLFEQDRAAVKQEDKSIPSVFKNAIDWMTRPASDIARVFGDRPVGLIGATPGGMGTTFSQTAWLPILRTLGTRPFFGKTLYVSGAAKVFDAEGRLTDKDLRERLRVYMEQFAAFVASVRAAAKPAQG